MLDVDCVGSELKLTDCSHRTLTTYGTCRYNVFINCNSTCTHGEVRLIGRRKPSKGRMEVCVNGLWRTVCDSYLDTVAAQVVCRQLGYTTNIGNWSTLITIATLQSNLHLVASFLMGRMCLWLFRWSEWPNGHAELYILLRVRIKIGWLLILFEHILS